MRENKMNNGEINYHYAVKGQTRLLFEAINDVYILKTKMAKMERIMDMVMANIGGDIDVPPGYVDLNTLGAGGFFSEKY
jgi:hypothetical protein